MLLTLAAVNDHTDVIVTSATELLKAILLFAGILATAGLGIGIPIHKKAVKERRTSRTTLDEVHEQLHNDHTKNFRVEQDEKFERLEQMITDGFDSQTERMDRHSRDIGAAKRASETAVREVAVIKKRLELHIDGRSADSDAQ